MGRAMLIICAGLFVALGIVSVSTSSQGTLMTENAAIYANETKALNAAHTAIQIAMQKINKDDSWADSHGSSTPWVTTIDGAETELYVNHIYEASDYWKPDSIRIVSKAEIIADLDTLRGRVRSVYLKAPFSNLVPKFQSAITIATNKIGSFNAQGSASISGNAPSGTSCEDMPAMTIADPAGSSMDSTSYRNELNDLKDADGNPLVKVDKDLNYQPTDELIDRLEESPDRINVDGNFGDPLGTENDPGIFFIQDGAKLTGKQTSGYGIMVIQSGADLAYEEDGAILDVAGNFEFNGLIIFENAYDFKGRGTPTINGSVLIGTTEDKETNINVDINGNIHMQYDCEAEEYAQMAAAAAIQQNKYTRVVTLQETQF